MAFDPDQMQRVMQNAVEADIRAATEKYRLKLAQINALARLLGPALADTPGDTTLAEIIRLSHVQESSNAG